MTQQIINIGASPNNGQGETLRSGAVKINENFSELYAAVGIGGDQTFVNSITGGTGITVSSTSGNITITNSAPNIKAFSAVTVAGQSSVSAVSNQSLALSAGSNVTLTTNALTNTITIAASQPDLSSYATQTYVTTRGYITSSALSGYALTSSVPTDVAQLADNTNKFGLNHYKTINQSTPTIAASGTANVYQSSENEIAKAIKATILVVGLNGTSDYQSQVSEVLISRTFPNSGFPSIHLVVIGSSYTGAGPLATFSAAWDNANGWTNISATNLSSTNTVQVNVVATEYLG